MIWKATYLLARFRGIRRIGVLGLLLVLIGSAGCSQETAEEAAQKPSGDHPNVSLEIVSPASGETIEGPNVSVSFDLKGYDVYMNEETGKGQHIHFILDNQPYIPHYTTEPFVFEDVAPGTHTIRAFPSREWHESIKSPAAFAIVTFHVGEEDGNNAPDPEAPLLTYSRPKGDYAGEAGERVLVDYWVKNCTIEQEDYRVRMRVDGNAQEFFEWVPYWLEGLSPGEHQITLELIDPTGAPVEGPFNRTERVFTISP